MKNFEATLDTFGRWLSPDIARDVGSAIVQTIGLPNLSGKANSPGVDVWPPFLQRVLRNVSKRKMSILPAEV